MTIDISIVTATLNRRSLLPRALASAMAQGAEGVEHIVIDGASTDGTLELLSGYPHLQVVSEPDKNLYAGWNKGIARARGRFVCLLNSDDEFAPGAFATVRRMMREAPSADMISGAIELVREIPEGHISAHVVDDAAMIALREQDTGPGVPLTNGRFFSRGLLGRVGPFDERYSVISDRQFLLRVKLANVVNATTDKSLYRYHVHGGSLTLNDRAPSLAQSRQCLAAAIDGMSEAGDAATRAAYRRWHSWAVFYLAGLETRAGRIGEAVRIVADASRRDPAWPLRLPRQLACHMRERQARRGRFIS